jgi:hypothetical protein
MPHEEVRDMDNGFGSMHYSSQSFLDISSIFAQPSISTSAISSELSASTQTTPTPSLDSHCSVTSPFVSVSPDSDVVNTLPIDRLKLYPCSVCGQSSFYTEQARE